ncbi:MAG TPA: HAD-IC family P-type ATPase [Kofleriaceae bacterium]|nr:HAD-IC family P-type ATPase [Kofleriaceae bacterium]
MDTARAWHALDVDEVIVALDTSHDGLSIYEAAVRLQRHGRNLLARTRRASPITLVVRQFENPLALVLLGSGLLAYLFGSGTDSVVIVSVVIVNALIGAVQELRAAKAIEALDSVVPDFTTTYRGGFLVQLSSADLVPGDMIMLERGARVPADVRVCFARNLQAVELALTGESVPVDKDPDPVEERCSLGDRRCMLFSGTILATGSVRGVVVATGAATELGKIAKLIQTAARPDTPLMRDLVQFGKRLTQIICAVAAILFYIAYRRGFPLYEAVRAAVSLACASIPVALPATITIALAVAVRRMAARNAIVRTLPSIETLGSTTIICSDKTGTLTLGEMTARRLWASGHLFELTGSGYAPAGELRLRDRALEPPEAVLELVRAAAVCNDAILQLSWGTWSGVGSPTEIALVVAARKLGVDFAAERNRLPRRDTIPFDATTRYMITLHDQPGDEQLVLVKGAPEEIVKRCNRVAGAEVELASVLEVVDLLAASGMRVIAVAAAHRAGLSSHIDAAELQGAELLGLIGLVDPPHPEAIPAIASCHGAGLNIKMVTGDHPATARAIGVDLGLVPDRDAQVVIGAEFEQLRPRQLARLAESAEVFARVEPEHKLRLVEALQTRNNVVAMTGDGVNDAPALRQADVGIAMGRRGTAAAREAADIILVDDNFGSIAAAVEEGRRCFDNLMKLLIFLVPTAMGQGLAILIGVIAFPIVDGVPLLPIIPLQILWVNFVTGVTLSVPLAWERANANLMQRAPRARGQPLFGRELIVRCVLVGVLMAASAIGLFLWQYDEARGLADTDLALRKAQTMAVTTIVLAQVFYLFQCRSLHTSVFRLEVTNPSVYLGVVATLAMHAAFVYAPPMQDLFHSAALGIEELVLSAATAALVLPAVSIHKWRARRASPEERAG